MNTAPGPPRRWPKRLLVGGVVVVMIAAVAAFVVSAFALSGSSIEEDQGSLGKVSFDTFGGKVESVSATAVSSGTKIPVQMKGDRIFPTAKLHPGEQVKVEVKVKRPSVVGAIAGGSKTLTTTATAPTAKLEQRWLSVKSGKNPRLRFDQPVSQIVYGQPGELKHRRFDKPRSSVTLGKQPAAGQMTVAWAAAPWEHPGKSKSVTWFPATGVPTVAASPTAGTTISASTPIELTFSKKVKKLFGPKDPTLDPEVDGKWSRPTPHTLEVHAVRLRRAAGDRPEGRAARRSRSGPARRLGEERQRSHLGSSRPAPKRASSSCSPASTTCPTSGPAKKSRRPRKPRWPPRPRKRRRATSRRAGRTRRRA